MVLVFSTVNVVFAEDTPTTDTTTVTVENAPSSLGMFWMNLQERASLWLTRDPLKKVEKQIVFAQKRIEVATKLLEKTDNTSVQAKAQEMIDRASDLLSKLEEKKDVLNQLTDEQKKELWKNYGEHMKWREDKLDELQNKVQPELFQGFMEKRSRVMEGSRRLLNAISNEKIPEEVRVRLEEVKLRIEEHAEDVKQMREEKREMLKKAAEGDKEAVKELNRVLQEERQKDEDSDL